MLLVGAFVCALYSFSQHTLQATIHGMHWFDEEDSLYSQPDGSEIRLEVEFFKETARGQFNGKWMDYQLVDLQRSYSTPFFTYYFGLYNEEFNEYHGFMVVESNFNEYSIYKVVLGETRYAVCSSNVTMDGVPTLIYHDKRYSVYRLTVLEADKPIEPRFAEFALSNHNFLAFYEPEGQGLFLANVMPKRNSQSFGPVTYVGERKVNGRRTVLLQWNYHNTYNTEKGFTDVEVEQLSDGRVEVRIEVGTQEELRLVCKPSGSWNEWMKWLE